VGQYGGIVTNFHVVAGASGARVRLSDGRDVAAALVGVSPAHDLAVIRVEVPKPPPPLPIGTSHDLRVGQRTFAIGTVRPGLDADDRNHFRARPFRLTVLRDGQQTGVNVTLEAGNR
jgi:hypothetical protein